MKYKKISTVYEDLEEKMRGFKWKKVELVCSPSRRTRFFKFSVLTCAVIFLFHIAFFSGKFFFYWQGRYLSYDRTIRYLSLGRNQRLLSFGDPLKHCL